MKQVTVYEVYHNEDSCEGRGATVLLGRFTTLNSAREIGKGAYVQGQDCPEHCYRTKVLWFDGERYYQEVKVLEETVKQRRKREMEQYAEIKLMAPKDLNADDIEFMQIMLDRYIDGDL